VKTVLDGRVLVLVLGAVVLVVGGGFGGVG
jgi:hypothetical protein